MAIIIRKNKIIEQNIFQVNNRRSFTIKAFLIFLKYNETSLFIIYLTIEYQMIFVPILSAFSLISYGLLCTS